MKKKFLLPILGLLCSNQVFGEQVKDVKKLKDREFVIKKNRNDSLQDITKPKSLIINSDDQKFVPYSFSWDDLSLDIKGLPVTLDLRSKEKKFQKIRNNLIRLGVGGQLLGLSGKFVHVADVLLKKKFGNFSSHLIVRSKTPYLWPGWLESVQFFTDYAVTDFCKPFFVFDQGWNNFYNGSNTDEGIEENKKSDLDLNFKIGCPLLLEKSEFKPELSFRHSKFSSYQNKKGDKDEDKFTENEFNLNFDMSFDAIDNINLSCDTNIKNLFYDKDCCIYDFKDSVLKKLDDKNNVTFFEATPKVSFILNQLEFAPKLRIDYCSNEKFIKSDDKTNFALGIDVGYSIDNLANFKLFYNRGLKPNTFDEIFKENPWAKHQAIVSSDNKWGIGLKSNVQVSNFKFNVCLQANSFNLYPTLNGFKWSNIKDFVYINDVKRYRCNVGAIYESDLFDVLMSASLDHYHSDNEDDLTCLEIKSDVSFSITDKILTHFSVIKPYGVFGMYFDAGIDYIFSDLFSFFVNCGDFGGLRIMFGTYITPDKWIEKDFNDQLV